MTVFPQVDRNPLVVDDDDLETSVKNPRRAYDTPSQRDFVIRSWGPFYFPDNFSQKLYNSIHRIRLSMTVAKRGGDT